MLITIDKYTMLQLQEYNNTFSLVEGWVKEGTFKPNFCKREFGKTGEKVEKTAPISIKIGTREQAISALKAILVSLGGESEAPF